MLKAFRYRLYPTKQQEIDLIKSIGCVRFVYNKALEAKIRHYEVVGTALSCFDLCGGLLLDLKKEFNWLKESNAQSLQASLRNLDNAFTNFFRKTAKFPNFKKKNNIGSIQYPQAVFVFFDKNQIKIPKLGKVKCKFDRIFEGKIKTCTVSKTPTNKFYISILVDDGKELPEKPPITKETSIGIDLGLKHFIITSNGEKINNPKYLSKSIERVKVLQRRASKKKKGSNNKKKANFKAAKIHERVANQRKDFLHKTSSKLIGDNQTVIVEDLNVAGMIKNRRLSRAISDVGWRMFVQFLTYKADWYGKNLLTIGRFDPSSKMCSNCGNINKELKLSDREWKCKNCNMIHDRDINAAINIKKFGLIKTKTGKELPEELVEMPASKRGSKKQEII